MELPLAIAIRTTLETLVKLFALWVLRFLVPVMERRLVAILRPDMRFAIATMIIMETLVKFIVIVDCNPFVTMRGG